LRQERTLEPVRKADIRRPLQPRGLTLNQLVNGAIPTAWPAQREAFGFNDLA